VGKFFARRLAGPRERFDAKYYLQDQDVDIEEIALRKMGALLEDNHTTAQLLT
jgi:hypothetical protein